MMAYNQELKSNTMKYAGIEAGGTKFVCVIGNAEGEIEARLEVPTQTPELTLPKIVDFIQQHKDIQALGIGCFGPIDPIPSSSTYGCITSTPKMAWRYFNIVAYFKAALALPIGFDTDVNAALLGEFTWGNAQGIKNAVYLTVGTGIGAGIMVEGHLLHGVMHAELGHMLIPQDKTQDAFLGVCPSHGNCLEGLASGPAIKERWKVASALELPAEHPAWALESDYLARALANVILSFSPERIILGGGVMKQQHLLPLVQQKTVQNLGGYIDNDSVRHIEKTIVPAGLGQDAGAKGALILALHA
jgi:fructokinase